MNIDTMIEELFSVIEGNLKVTIQPNIRNNMTNRFREILSQEETAIDVIEIETDEDDEPTLWD